MWTADAELVRAYKACFTTVITNMREGEEVDLAGACIQETKALQRGTQKAAAYY